VIRPFNSIEDYAIIVNWWKARDMAPTPMNCLPGFGLVAMQGEERIAAGWLLGTDTKASYVESLVTNPECFEYQRGWGAIAVVMALMDEATARGYERLRVLTTTESVAGLTKRLGGVPTRWVVLEGKV
jgi:hypothetical protein